MNIAKAIKRLEAWHRSASKRQNPEDFKAMKLGIEALKRLAFNRLNTIASSDELLPGETKIEERGYYKYS